MDMACRIGDYEQALHILREAVNAGHWYAQLDANPTFAQLKGLPEFEELLLQCAERRATAIANAPMVIKMLPPAQILTPTPLVIALHGNSEHAEMFAVHWQSVPAQGWLVALPQSPEALGPERYVWNDWAWVIPAVQAYDAHIRRTYLVDESRVVLAGFSMGAGLALTLALEQKIAVRGVIAIAPFLRRAEMLRPLLALESSRRLRFYLAASQADDYCYGIARDLAKLFTEYHIEHHLDLYDDAGHAFPSALEQQMPAALAYITGGVTP